jgi:undecaprenol kinase/diacylglycerol kinase (ATP)
MTPTDSPQPQKRRNTLTDISKALGHALSGFCFALHSEPHMRFHVIAACVASLLGIFFGLSALEWALISASIGIVMLTELLNTAVEITLDACIPTYHPKVKAAKDVAAAAVWIAALMASTIGSLIFIPKFVRLLA